jgi:hypothetical protein
MEILMGIQGDLRINVQASPTPGNTDATERIKGLHEVRDRVKILIAAAKQSQARYHNRKRMDQTFKIGQWVMLRNKNITTGRFSRKIDDRQIGPFRVLNTWGTNAYKLDLPPRYRELHPVFHVSLLEPYYIRSDQQPAPEAVWVDNEQEYAVEDILAERTFRNVPQYLVRWKGWPIEEATWEPQEELKDVAAVDAYLQRKEEGQQPKRRRGRPPKQDKTG